MKVTLLIILNSLFIHLFAPPYLPTITKQQSYQFTILTSAKFIKYYPLIRAVVQVESKGDTLAYNFIEGAIGAFQIRQCRVDHYNRLKGTNYVLKDFYNYDLSLEMFLYFAGNKPFEIAAKNWNGSGKLTEIYWNKVNQLL